MAESLKEFVVVGSGGALRSGILQNATTSASFTRLTGPVRDLAGQRHDTNSTEITKRPLEDPIANSMETAGRDSGGAAKDAPASKLNIKHSATSGTLGLTIFPKTGNLFSGVANDNIPNSSPGSGDLIVIGKERALSEPHGDMPK